MSLGMQQNAKSFCNDCMPLAVLTWMLANAPFGDSALWRLVTRKGGRPEQAGDHYVVKGYA